MASGSSRDPWLDNAKMALVTLVVVGHTWTLLPEEGPNARLYDFLYAWHMPAFVLVTGYLSQSFAYTPARMWALVRTVAVPYVVFECAMALFRVHVGGERLEDLFTDPHWPLWFLAALFLWRLLTPVFRPLPAGVAVAVALSVAAGLWAGDTLDLARVMGLLPFFVLGLKLTPERLEALRSVGARVAGVLVFAGIWFLAGFTDRFASTEWLYYRAQYDELAVSDLRAAVIRLAILAIGAAGAFAFLTLVPRVEGWFTRMGAATIVVYLFHGFAVKGLEYAGYEEWAADHALAALLLATAIGLVLSLGLAAPPVARRLEHVVDPFGGAQRRVVATVDLAITPTRTERRVERHARSARREAAVRRTTVPGRTSAVGR